MQSMIFNNGDDILSSIQEQLSHAKKRIKEAAQNVLTRQQEGVLAKTSVDELSRQRKRIRITPLKENGYGTILDLKKASVFDISRIEGIGWQGACDIKRASDEIIQTVEKTTTIRLDSGKQYECCTELLKTIYFQERSKDLRKNLRTSSVFRKEMNPAMLSSIRRPERDSHGILRRSKLRQRRCEACSRCLTIPKNTVK